MPTQLRSGDQAPYATWACIIKYFFKFFYLFVIESQLLYRLITRL